MKTLLFIIFILCALFIQIPSLVWAKTLICMEGGDNKFKHRLVFNFPDVFSHTLTSVNKDDTTLEEEPLVRHALGKTFLDWGMIDEKGESIYSDRYSLYFTRNTEKFLKTGIGNGQIVGTGFDWYGNSMMVRIETSETQLPFRFHSSYSLHRGTFKGTCK